MLSGSERLSAWAKTAGENARYASMYLRQHYDVEEFYTLLGQEHQWGEARRCLNLGYWRGARTMQEANEALVDLLGDFAELQPGQVVLDAGCGFGDQDIRWVERHGVSHISALNIAPFQVREARAAVEARGLTGRIDVKQGSATALDEPPGSFDRVLALESAFHFQTRESFFREAFRVLAPSGKLALADVVFAPSHDGLRNRLTALMHRASLQYQAQNMYSADAYASKLASAGFENIEVRSIKYFVFAPFRRHLLEHPQLFRRHFWLFRWWLRHADRLSRGTSHVLDYVLVRATKPARG